jgi:hypothetical protein
LAQPTPGCCGQLEAHLACGGPGGAGGAGGGIGAALTQLVQAAPVDVLGRLDLSQQLLLVALCSERKTQPTHFSPAAVQEAQQAAAEATVASPKVSPPGRQVPCSQRLVLLHVRGSCCCCTWVSSA